MFIVGWGLRIEMEAKTRKRFLTKGPCMPCRGVWTFNLLVRSSQGFGWDVRDAF